MRVRFLYPALIGTFVYWIGYLAFTQGDMGSNPIRVTYGYVSQRLVSHTVNVEYEGSNPFVAAYTLG